MSDFDRATLKHSPFCELQTAVRRKGCCCEANQRILDAIAAGHISQDQVIETCHGGEYEDWDDD